MTGARKREAGRAPAEGAAGGEGGCAAGRSADGERSAVGGPAGDVPPEVMDACDAACADGEATEKLELVMGAAGLARLAAAHVAVLGLGGVGSNCVEALARGGAGHLFLVDRDIVQASNINRQAIAFRSTLGRRKVDVMRSMVADINPAAAVETRHMLVLRENLGELLDEMAAWARADGGRLDYVIDAIDTVSAKLALAELAQERGIPLISSMGAANKLHPEALRIADLYDTVNCPLCRIMRKEGRKRGIRSLRVLYSSEEPVRVPARAGAERRERSNLGTASFMPPIMGQMIAGAVLCEIAGVGDAR